MYACMHACMYVCMYVCLSVCLYVCMHACIVCMSVCLYVCIVCMSVCMYACMHACMCVCVCVCVCVRVRVRVRVYCRTAALSAVAPNGAKRRTVRCLRCLTRVRTPTSCSGRTRCSSARGGARLSSSIDSHTRSKRRPRAPLQRPLMRTTLSKRARASALRRR
jgi:hypothetical protein